VKHEDLPPRWKTKVVEWIRAFADDSRERFGAGDFPCSHSISMTFDDGSTASFFYAILIEAPESNEVGVFTEHCGYHIFPLAGTHVARIET
jgi:hypothetical protein